MANNIESTPSMHLLNKTSHPIVMDFLDLLANNDQWSARNYDIGLVDALLQKISAHSDVPCFILSAKDLGRTDIAKIYAQLYYQAQNVQWLDASNQSFYQSIERGNLLTHFHCKTDAEIIQKKLMVLDNLLALDQKQAFHLSNAIDELIEQNWQVLVITCPQNDRYESLQSDRLLINASELTRLRNYSPRQVQRAVTSFLHSNITPEQKFFALSATLAGSLSCKETTELGFRFSEVLPAQICDLHPFFSYNHSTSELHAPTIAVSDLSAEIEQLLSDEMIEFLGSDKTTGEPVKILDYLTKISILLLQRGEHARSRELLDFATGSMTGVARNNTNSDCDLRFSDISLSPQNIDIPILHVNIFGGLQVFRGDVPIEHISLNNSRAQQLLMLLALTFGSGVSQDSLVQRFWASSQGNRGLENLYVLWSRLAKILSGDGSRTCPYLTRSSGVLRLNERYVQVDVSMFELLAKEILFGDEPASLRILKAQQLDAIYGRGIVLDKQTDALILSKARRLCALYVDVMLEASKLYEQLDNLTTAMWYANKAFETDASKEEVYRALMDAQIKAGRRTSAMQTYFACKNYLSEELGILPSHLTTNLYQEIIMDSY